MTKRIIVILYSIVPLIGGIFSFSVIMDFESDTPLRGNDVLWIRSGSEQSSFSDAAGRQFSEKLHREIESRSLNIALVTPLEENPDGGNHLDFLLTNTGDPSAAWATQDYSSFNPRYHVAVGRLAPDRADPRGIYLVFGDQQRIRGLADSLAQPGLTITQYQLLAPSNLWRVYGSSSLLIAWVATVVTVSFASGTAAVVGSRRYARKRLYGWSRSRTLITETRRIVAVVGASTVAMLIAAALCLWPFNGLASFGIFAALAVGITLVTAIPMTLAHLASIVALYCVPISDGLKGRLPVRFAFSSLIAVKVVGLALLMSTLAYVPSVGALAQQYLRSTSEWNRIPEAAFVSLRAEAGTQEMMHGVSPWVLEELRAGNIILSHAETVTDVIEDLDHIDPMSFIGTPVMYVNDTYLAQFSDQLPEVVAWRQKTHPALNHAHVFVPDGVELTSQQLENIIPHDVPEEFASTTERHAYSPPGDVFRLGDSHLDDAEYVRDPIVVFLPDRLLEQTGQMMTAWATSNGVAVKDQSAAESRLRDSDADHFVLPLARGREVHAAHRAKNLSELRMTSYTTGIYILVLGFAVLAFALVFSRENGQKIFRRVVHGWPKLRGARLGLIATGLVGAIGVAIVFHGLVAVTQHAQDRLLDTATYSSQIRWFAVAGFGALAAFVIFSVVALSRAARREIKERSRTP